MFVRGSLQTPTGRPSCCCMIITGPSTHGVGGQTSNGHGRLSSCVTLHGRPAGDCTRAGEAMKSCRSSLIIAPRLHGGPVVLHPVRASFVE